MTKICLVPRAFLLSLSILASFSVCWAGTDINSVVPDAARKYDGLRAFKPVLDGVLYRGGGSGGQKPMSRNQLEALCKDGFSGAGYLYSTGMNGNQSLNCELSNGHSNRLDYKVYGFRQRSDRYRALSEIHDIITQRRGPLFMHCWNGWHASGEIAAVALMQFCGWSGAKAGEYWKKNVGDPANLPKYGSIWKKHIGEFEPFADLRISPEEQSRICP